MPDREKVIAWLADEELYYRDHGDTHNSLMACNALELLKEQPEIVRCKDCKWFEMPRYGERGFCKNVELIRETTFYCADGKRRDDNG